APQCIHSRAQTRQNASKRPRLYTSGGFPGAPSAPPLSKMQESPGACPDIRRLNPATRPSSPANSTRDAGYLTRAKPASQPIVSRAASVSCRKPTASSSRALERAGVLGVQAASAHEAEHGILGRLVVA